MKLRKGHQAILFQHSRDIGRIKKTFDPHERRCYHFQLVCFIQLYDEATGVYDDGVNTFARDVNGV